MNCCICNDHINNCVSLELEARPSGFRGSIEVWGYCPKCAPVHKDKKVSNEPMTRRLLHYSEPFELRDNKYQKLHRKLIPKSHFDIHTPGGLAVNVFMDFRAKR